MKKVKFNLNYNVVDQPENFQFVALNQSDSQDKISGLLALVLF